MRQPVTTVSLIDQKATLRMVGVGSRETLARWIRRGLFPPPIHVGGGRLRWVLAEVEAWIEAKRLERSPCPVEASSARRTVRRPAATIGPDQRHV